MEENFDSSGYKFWLKANHLHVVKYILYTLLKSKQR